MYINQYTYSMDIYTYIRIHAHSKSIYAADTVIRPYICMHVCIHPYNISHACMHVYISGICTK